ncbi:hypothetical protein AGABI1DRAFT_114140 [Agaricus bisporus var. burnettii JB137-S8]|uniref:Peptidase A1 domain-containing protein n=1 Tax=Agaricus bisporus var. burnettii (strain JB137-S8 / ATCC MYA-4627 / FGSC 10392) TaxID=597362 RepID=K5WW14_AGABU|nr:uncharacterized protein AGABI1DRAFT_114140 [Agaricus bisporus var. burnettii JB137-S8]EKM79641.1 hypothetical protein AGABI1DRAFT_114140 [Agaricus bisporus var. burnettii JB137-S8]
MLTSWAQVTLLVASSLSSSVSAFPANPDDTTTQNTKPRGYNLPIHRRIVERSNLGKRGSVTGQTGLGDHTDLLYSVPIELGDSVVAVNLDTGSSDLWVVSDACTAGTCADSNVRGYSPMSSNANSTGVRVEMFYGDSKTGTYAKGNVGFDTATVAGIAMTDQAFGIINDTTNVVLKYDTAGIFGLGFPVASKVQEFMVTAEDGPIKTTDNYLLSTYTHGPLLPRIVITGALPEPIFSITLNRATIDISGVGELAVGKVPDGVDPSSLTWVPVRLYRPSDGGLHAPVFAPNEIYPLRWEIDIDDVYFDGQRLAPSTIPTSDDVDTSKISALIDTGNSVIRGPEDVVTNIRRTVSPSYQPSDPNSQVLFPCTSNHTLAFQIGGKMFPIDPRDFIGQYMDNNATTCIADNVVTTDPPRFGSLYRWSFGDPFFRSNLVVFHYGNLTHPSVDPPRIGILSRVPPNANDLYQQAVQDAVNNGGNFEETLHIAPTASAAQAPQITVSAESGSISSMISHLTAGATLSLSATQMAIPTNNPNNAFHALPRTSILTVITALLSIYILR